jgi:hypothetical protein
LVAASDPLAALTATIATRIRVNPLRAMPAASLREAVDFQKTDDRVSRRLRDQKSPVVQW